MVTGEIISEDSYEYSGLVAELKRGTYIEAPKPSAQELAIQQEQLELLRQSRAESELLKPYVMASMGLVEEDGKLRKLSEEELMATMSPVEKTQYDLAKMAQERLLQAYEGKLPISPALEEDLQKREKQMQEGLSQKLGPNWQLSTPGRQAMGELVREANLLKEEARRGAIDTGTALLLSNLGYLHQAQGQRTAEAAQFPGRNLGLFGGYAQALQPYQRQRELEYEANKTNAMMSAQRRAGAMSGLGSLLGAGLNAAATYALIKKI